MLNKPTKDQWADWANHPCTQEMVRILTEFREDGIEEIAYGCDGNDVMRYGVKVGKVNALTGLINLTFIPEEETNDN